MLSIGLRHSLRVHLGDRRVPTLLRAIAPSPTCIVEAVQTSAPLANHRHTAVRAWEGHLRSPLGTSDSFAVLGANRGPLRIAALYREHRPANGASRWLEVEFLRHNRCLQIVRGAQGCSGLHSR